MVTAGCKRQSDYMCVSEDESACFMLWSIKPIHQEKSKLSSFLKAVVTPALSEPALTHQVTCIQGHLGMFTHLFPQSS